MREMYYRPEVTDNYHIEYGAVNEKGLCEFLCKEREFSRERVEMAEGRVKGR